MGGKYTSVTLPFTTFSFVDDDRAIEFSPGTGNQAPQPSARAVTWRCALDSYTCRQSQPGGRGGRGGGGLTGPVRAPFDVNGAEPQQVA